MNTESAIIRTVPRQMADGSYRAAAWAAPVRSMFAFKGCYLLLVAVAVWLFSNFEEGRFFRVNARWPREGDPIFLSHFATWDAAHYLRLSEAGYANDVPSCAFYPLWPLLMRWGSVFTGGNHVAAGMILANAFSAAGWVIFFQLAGERFGSRAAWWALGFLALFPGSLFFQFVYSEALFFFLVMLFVLGLERRWYGLVWASGFLLPLTRAVGFFCVAPLVWHLVRCRVQSPKSKVGKTWKLGLGVRGLESKIQNLKSKIISC